MNIALLSSDDALSRAGQSCQRLHRALLRQQLSARLLVRHQSSAGPEVETVSGRTAWADKLVRTPKPRAAMPTGAPVAFANGRSGGDLADHAHIRAADILHLHSVQPDLLSVTGLQKLFSLQKPLVWTLHDTWAFTGGCYDPFDCTQYLTHCGQCPQLRNAGRTDASYYGFRRKLALYEKARLQLVASSQHLREQIAASPLLGRFPVQVIPPALDTRRYRPYPQKTGIYHRHGLDVDHRLILCGPGQGVVEAMPGFHDLCAAFRHMVTDAASLDYGIVLTGKAEPMTLDTLPFTTHHVGAVATPEVMVEFYNAADVFVWPEPYDYAPLPVLEALACGTPVVAFRHGALAELIDHQRTGYLAQPGDAADLARGIDWVLHKADLAALRTEARRTAEARHDEIVVAAQYRALYEEMLP